MKKTILILLVLMTHYAWAQIFIQGTVTNKKGEPMFAANIFEKNNMKNVCSTDFDGKFKLKVSLAQTTIVASFIGFKTREIDLQTIDLSKDIRIVLHRESKALGEVVVKAQDPISERFSVAKMNRYNIYFNAMAQADPLKAVTALPASTTVDETANPSLRGSSPDRTRVVLNGVPIYTPVRSSQLNNQGFFSLFSPEMIHRQYIYASNPPLTYSNTSAGLVEIQTVKSLQQNSRQFTLGIGGIACFISQKLKNEQSFVQVYANLQKSDAFIGMQKKHFPNLKAFNSKDGGFNIHGKLSKRWR